MRRSRCVSPGKSFNLRRSFVSDEAKITDEGWVQETGEPLNGQAGSFGIGPME